MPDILTSWKEIGRYLGKGVRTVQRWERESGLPVRRRSGGARAAVHALPEELDAWANARTRGPSGPVAESLRREMAALRSQNLELGSRLEAVELLLTGSAPASLPEAPVTPASGASIRQTAQQTRGMAVRTRLSWASTLCTIGENRARGGDLSGLRRARHSLQAIRRSLESPGYVPLGELQELRAQLLMLARRIESLANRAGLESDDEATPPATRAGFIH